MATLTGKSIKNTYTSLLKLEGDTQTPAAGSTGIQVKTGDDNATPIYITSDRVGIGHSTPAFQLSIKGAADVHTVLSISGGASAKDAKIYFQENMLTKWQVGYNTASNRFDVYNDSTDKTPFMIADGANADNVLYIDTNKVSINTTTQNGILTVKTPGSPSFVYTDFTGAAIVIDNGAQGTSKDTQGGGIYFTENGQQGQVGAIISTVNPTTDSDRCALDFHVHPGTGSDPVNHVMRMKENSVGINYKGDGDGDIGASLWICPADATTSGQAPAGDADDLVLDTSGTSVGMSFLCAADGEAQISFGHSGSSDIGNITYHHTGDIFKIKQAGTTALQIDGTQSATFASGLVINGNTDLSTGSAGENYGRALSSEIKSVNNGNIAMALRGNGDTDRFAVYISSNNDGVVDTEAFSVCNDQTFGFNLDGDNPSGTVHIRNSGAGDQYLPALILENTTEDINKQGGELRFQRRDGSEGEYIADGKVLGEIQWDAYDYNDTSYFSAAKITCLSDATCSTTSNPGRLEFYTTPVASQVPVLNMTLDSAGKLGIGTVEDYGRVTITSGSGERPLGIRRTGVGDLIRWNIDGDIVGGITTDGSGTGIYGGSSAVNTHIFIKSNGNVGINDTTPVVKLDIAGHMRTSDGNRHIFGGFTGDNDHGPYISYDTGADTFNIVSGYNTAGGDYATGGIRFGVANGSTWSEKVRMLHDGKFVIASSNLSTAPNHLNVFDASGGDVMLGRLSGTIAATQNLGTLTFKGSEDNGTTWGEGAKICGVVTDTWDTSGTDYGTSLKFYTADNGTPLDTATDLRMTINHDGKIGIGESTPTELLHIHGDTPKITITNTAETEAGIKFSDIDDIAGQHFEILYASGASGTAGADASERLYFRSDDTASDSAVLSLEPGGNVGIGILNASATLHIQATVPTIKLTESDSGDEAVINADSGDLDIKYTTVGGNAYIDFDAIADDGTSSCQYRFGNIGDSNASSGETTLKIYDNDAVYLQHQLRSSGGDSYVCARGGDFGIGTTDPAYGLDVASDRDVRISGRLRHYRTIYVDAEASINGDGHPNRPFNHLDAVLEECQTSATLRYHVYLRAKGHSAGASGSGVSDGEGTQLVYNVGLKADGTHVSRNVYMTVLEFRSYKGARDAAGDYIWTDADNVWGNSTWSTMDTKNHGAIWKFLDRGADNGSYGTNGLRMHGGASLFFIGVSFLIEDNDTPADGATGWGENGYCFLSDNTHHGVYGFNYCYVKLGENLDFVRTSSANGLVSFSWYSRNETTSWDFATSTYHSGTEIYQGIDRSAKSIAESVASPRDGARLIEASAQPMYVKLSGSGDMVNAFFSNTCDDNYRDLIGMGGTTTYKIEYNEGGTTPIEVPSRILFAGRNQDWCRQGAKASQPLFSTTDY